MTVFDHADTVYQQLAQALSVSTSPLLQAGPSSGAELVEAASRTFSLLVWALLLAALVPVVFLVYKKLFTSLRSEQETARDPQKEILRYERREDFLSAAGVCEELKDFSRAAAFFEKARDFSRAAEMYESAGHTAKAPVSTSKQANTWKPPRSSRTRGTTSGPPEALPPRTVATRKRWPSRWAGKSMRSVSTCRTTSPSSLSSPGRNGMPLPK